MSSLSHYLIILLIFVTIDTILIIETYDIITDVVNPTQPFTSPCPIHTVPKDNNRTKITNGCGSLPWEILAGKIVYPFSRFFDQCCAIHDVCFDTCGAPHYLQHYQQCNKAIEQCMSSSCDQVSQSTEIGLMGKVVKRRCLKNAEALMKLLDTVGLQAYQRAQNQHCDCLLPN